MSGSFDGDTTTGTGAVILLVDLEDFVAWDWSVA
jgi:hypothetical protein